ncbi:hypothetical protein BH708_07470 [Brachybacterium sp. P6-10-X1]|uniref:hypothetical protein n=1 Tax=Brachybacterium sp. P6-10-X1 TaxID=1903186 RepID=UPI00097177FA|nr:hypothetical protein [Brachybacterium sp. P6-10-X1]APX32583.1 hypothetical protein BH708_07470 [Brachybacterium sp. P6-10-X1]
MEMTISEDCGNSPRMAIVADVAVAWAAAEEETVRGWLREDVAWTLVGEPAPASDGYVRPPLSPESGEILTVLNHGRLAACDGYLVRGRERVDFCHVIRFAGTSKTARIREIRTYLQHSATAD